MTRDGSAGHASEASSFTMRRRRNRATRVSSISSTRSSQLASAITSPVSEPAESLRHPAAGRGDTRPRRRFTGQFRVRAPAGLAIPCQGSASPSAVFPDRTHPNLSHEFLDDVLKREQSTVLPYSSTTIAMKFSVEEALVQRLDRAVSGT